MNELIKIEARDSKQTCNARNLWTFMESKQEFAHWIKNRIENYGFVEGKDFLINLTKRSTTGIGRGLKEYYFTISTAKEICMLENNSKGQEARRYFIACENKLKEIVQPKLPTHLETARLLVTALEDKEKALLQIAHDKPKVDFANGIAETNDAILIGVYAKLVQNLKGIKVGQNRLFFWMRQAGYLMTGGSRHNLPYQQYTQNGYFKVRETRVDTKDGSRVKFTPLITGKGQVAIYAKLQQHFMEKVSKKGGQDAQYQLPTL